MAARKYTSNTPLIKERDDDTPRQLATNKAAILYIRRSTPGQEDNEASLILQDGKMEARLRRKGFTEIIKIAVDDLTSGQDIEREGIGTIEKLVKAQPIGAVAAFNASRLWRDRTHVYDNKFLDLLAKHRIPVIFNHATFWPNDIVDREKVQDEFKEAAKGLNQFDLFANPARVAIAELGRYAGHAVPAGYIVVGTKKNKHYQIYQPHAEHIVRIFKRYQALNGNLGRLSREFIEADFHLPEFDQDELRKFGANTPHLGLKHCEKGYELQSRTALFSILTNVAYLGWYAFSWKDEDTGEKVTSITSKEAHLPIIEDFELFKYAFDRLSKYTLDGEVNEQKPVIDRHYSKVPALLEGLFTAYGDVPMYIIKSKDYAARRDVKGNKTTELVVSIKLIDTVFSQTMIGFLAMLELGKLSSSLEEKVKALKTEKEEKTSNLAERLASIDKGIRQWELAKLAAIEAESQSDMVEAMKQLKRLRADKEAVEQQAKQTIDEIDELEECGNLLECAVQEWEKMGFEKQRRLVKLIVGHVNIEEVAPHMLKLEIVLTEPVNHVLTCYIYRVRGSLTKYTEAENATLRRLYQTADRATILEAVPMRTWDSIVVQAGKVLKIVRQKQPNTSEIPDGLTHADAELLKSLGVPVKLPIVPFWSFDKLEHIAGFVNISMRKCFSLSYIISELKLILAA